MALEELSPSATSLPARRVVERLASTEVSLAGAESLTGGLLALRLTQAPGSGELFRGGIVAYLTGVKHELLQVPSGPVISAGCAETMAANVAHLLDADVGLATTGVAGPATQEGQEVGTVFVGYWINGEVGARRLSLSPAAPPDHIREATVDIALTLLDHRLGELETS